MEYSYKVMALKGLRGLLFGAAILWTYSKSCEALVGDYFPPEARVLIISTALPQLRNFLKNNMGVTLFGAL